MIIALDKLLTFEGNRYILTKALMRAVDKVNNIKDYPEGNKNWKVVPNIIRLMLDDKLKYEFNEPEPEE